MSAHKLDVTFSIVNKFFLTQSYALPKQTFYEAAMFAALLASYWQQHKVFVSWFSASS